MIPISDESWRFTASSQKRDILRWFHFSLRCSSFFFTSAVFCSGCSFSNKFYCEARGFFGGERELFKYSEVRDSKKRSEDTALHLSAALSLTDVQTRRRVRAYGSALLSVYPAACSLLIQRVTCVRTVSAPAELAGVMWSLGGFLSHRCGSRTKNVVILI